MREFLSIRFYPQTSTKPRILLKMSWNQLKYKVCINEVAGKGARINGKQKKLEYILPCVL